MITRKSKYDLVAEQTRGMHGTLADVGARDRVLQKYLQPGELQYLSSDVIPGHDFTWDIEKAIPAGDRSFSVVAALDVLEHIEQCHCALRELLRITDQKLFVSLPNMSGLSFRLHFMRYGQLSAKYDLLPVHQGDRHRWLVVYDQAVRFIHAAAPPSEWKITQYDIVAGYARFHALFARLPLPPKLRAWTMLFKIERN